MQKWIAGIASTVIGAVLIYWLTTGLNKPNPPQAVPSGGETYRPAPPPAPAPAKSLRGYLVVESRSRINAVEDLGVGGKLCASGKGIQDYLRTSPSMSKYNVIAVPSAELSQALQAGVCAGVFVFQKEDADRLFPVGPTSVRLIPVTE